MNKVAVKARYTCEIDPEAPHERMHDSEDKARGSAAEYTTRMRGKVELFAGEGIPPFSVYRSGLEEESSEQFSPTYIRAHGEPRQLRA